MAHPERRHRRALTAAAIGLAAVGILPATAAAPVKVAPYIVMAPTVGEAQTAVLGVIGVTGIGSLGEALPLVNGTMASLSAGQAAALGTMATPDVSVRTAGKPAPAPRQLDDVFPDVTGARDLAPDNTGQGVTVAVVDTGIAPLPDFGTRLLSGTDLSGEGNATLDSFGHGTFVAGLVAGDGYSSDGTYIGEAPGASLIPVKVAGRSGATSVSTLIKALQWVQEDGRADVVNLSVGAIPVSPTLFNPLDQAVEALWRAGIVVVTSAGNNGNARGTITSPGDDPLVITVGALDTKDTIDPALDTVPSFSSHGPTSYDGWWKPDLLAPGKSVVSLMPRTSVTWNAYKSARVGTNNFVGSGTSFSAAITSGAVALLLNAKPTATPDEVKAALLTTTNQGPGAPNDPFEQGHGVLDVGQAVALPALTPAITMWQDFVLPDPPVLGTAFKLLTTQLVSTWANDDILLSNYPFPYSADPTTDDYFVSKAWNSAAWDSKAWNGEAWDSKAWNDQEWNSKAWNSKAWNSTAWN